MYLVWIALTLAVLSAGCSEKWDTTQKPVHDEEADAAFFAGVNFKGLADVPEPTSLRPCCILGNDIGAEVGSIPVPGYEIRYTLDIESAPARVDDPGCSSDKRPFSPRGSRVRNPLLNWCVPRVSWRTTWRSRPGSGTC